MLYLYRTCDVGNSGEDFVTDVELAFTSLHEYLLDMIRTDEVVRDILKKIDGSTMIEGDVIRTKFGVTSINDCSSGCKAAILTYLYGCEDVINKFGIHYINVAEAGDNAISVIMKMSVSRDVYIHCNRVIRFGKEYGQIIFEGNNVELADIVGVM